MTSKCRYKCRCKSINVGVNKTEKALLGIISSPEKTADEIAIEIVISKRTAECSLASLKKKGLIEQIGTDKK